MGPKSTPSQYQEDLFRQRLNNMIDMNHPLVRLSKLIDRTAIEKEFCGLFVSTIGAPAKSPHLVAGLLYLKHIHALSDEALIHRWVENPYWRYLCGKVTFQTEPPLDLSSLTRLRKRLGDRSYSGNSYEGHALYDQLQ